MAAEVIGGPRTWSMKRDAEGYRTYKIAHLVLADETDGPNTVINATGLPQPQDIWSFEDDVDVWAWVRPNADVTIHEEIEGQPSRIWRVEQIASNKPLDDAQQKCNDRQVENPLLEPQRVSGNYVKYLKEITHDLNGPIRTSSHELVRGPQVEFDHNRPSIRIQQNVPSLQPALVDSMVDTVNAYPLWGFNPRHVKLSNFSWRERWWGQCFKYYERTFDFDIRRDGFDRILLDEGTKVLNGHWDDATGNWTLDDIGGAAPDPSNPAHFIRFTDRQANPARVILDGKGQPYNPAAAASITPGTSCSPVASLPTVFQGILYGPFTLNANSTHWFRLTGGGGDNQWVSILAENQSLRDKDIDFVGWNNNCSSGAVFAGTPIIAGDRATNQFKSDTADLIISVTNSFLLVDVTYHIIWLGYASGSQPGRIHVVHYPMSDFLQLGIPATIGN